VSETVGGLMKQNKGRGVSRIEDQKPNIHNLMIILISKEMVG
jgi:hypothetical protein